MIFLHQIKSYLITNTFWMSFGTACIALSAGAIPFRLLQEKQEILNLETEKANLLRQKEITLTFTTRS